MKVAFVVQRCGAEVNGGAESLCLQLAQHMAAHWEVEILTTCALDYMSWDNFYPEGQESLNGARIRRFAVDELRDVAHFDKLSAELAIAGANASLEAQEQWMRAQGPYSSGLLAAIESSRHEYDAFIFFGYLYATTYFGLPLVRDRAWLAPLGHDEWTIHLGMWDKFFALPTGFIFQTPEEREFLQKRFPALRLSGPVAGIGVDAPARLEPEQFRTRYGLKENFLLYVGRIDFSKGCKEMFRYFMRFSDETATPITLVLIGREVLPIPFHDHIVHLGFVEEALKWDAMAACDWLLLPSSYESLSIVMLEAWLAGRPSLVNGNSPVMVGHCRRSHGGVWYDGYREWAAAIETITPTIKEQLGEQGRAYVRANYSWKRIEHEYLTTLTPARPQRSAATR